MCAWILNYFHINCMVFVPNWHPTVTSNESTNSNYYDLRYIPYPTLSQHLYVRHSLFENQSYKIKYIFACTVVLTNRANSSNKSLHWYFNRHFISHQQSVRYITHPTGVMLLTLTYFHVISSSRRLFSIQFVLFVEECKGRLRHCTPHLHHNSGGMCCQ